jgi:zinc transporter
MNTANLPFAQGTNGTEYAIGLIIASIALAWWLLKRVDIL